jgi:hypothetical protein
MARPDPNSHGLLRPLRARGEAADEWACECSETMSASERPPGGSHASAEPTAQAMFSPGLRGGGMRNWAELVAAVPGSVFPFFFYISSSFSFAFLIRTLTFEFTNYCGFIILN